MSLIDTPPESVSQALTRGASLNGNGLHNDDSQKRNGNGSQETHPEPEIRLSLATDLAQNGEFGERWLLVDDTNVSVVSYSSNGKAHIDLSRPISGLREARTETLVDSGALLLVDKSGDTAEALRYSTGLSGVFAGAARAIKSYIDDEDVPESIGKDMRRKKCPTCGDPLPEDTGVCIRCIDKRAVLLRLLSFAFPYPKQLILMTALMIIGTFLGILPTKVQQILTDSVLVPHKHISWIPWIVFLLILMSGMAVALNVWRGRVAAWLSNHIVYSIRTIAYERLQSLSLGYYDKRQTGSLLARITQDVNELQAFIVDGIQLFVVNTLQIVMIMATLLVSNWQLTLLVLIPVPLTVYLTRRISKVLWNTLHRLYYVRSGLSGAISSVLSGVRVVKAFAQEARETEKFRKRSHTLFEAQVNVEKAWATYFPILGFITTLGTYVIWFYGGREVVHNPLNLPGHGMTLGYLMMFLNFIAMLMSPLSQMTRMADWLSRSTAAAERVFEVIDAEPDVLNASDAVRMPRIEGRVELKNVRFSYDKNQNVLQDVSLTVEPGEMIGLVGHTGAGKSTLINLLSRFYDVQEGAILIDGVDIRQIDVEDLRSQVGVVLQEPFLFPGTIADNIAYARPDSSRLEIMKAAKAANAHDFVMKFADGYDTYVGERGARLSGGERQRLSIARAILHNPRILILDEATASVDTETEKKIQEAIGRLITGRTTFAIAHRLSTLRNASRLVVIERGKVAEVGTHDELMALPEGIFRKLVNMQQEVNKMHQEVSELNVV